MSKRQGNEVPDGTNEIRTAKQSRANAKRKFVRKTIGFSEMVEGDCPFLAIQEKYADVKEAFSHLEQCNELVNSAINGTGPHHLISQMLDECDDYMMEIEKEMDRIRAAFALRTTKENHAMSELRVRPLETPHFSGNIRQYSSFKQDFQRLIARQYGRDPFALRQCLSGEALQIIRGVENNYDEMFRRLDDKFGEPRKIVDAVILDIKRLKPVSEGDHASFIHLVDVIERSWLELSRLGLSQEMDTTTMVTMIERLMPRTQKREWVTKLDRREDCDSGEGSKFQSLLSYLLQERRVMDYMDSDIRGHSNIRKVNQVRKQIEVANDNSSIICSNEPNEMDVMQVYNHIQNIADRMEGLLKTGERQSKDKAPTQQSNTNINCWFHRTDSHSIYKCNAFLNLTHEEKLQNMRQHGVCFNCLQPGHIAASCAIANQCDKLKISGQVCGKRHHPCLHLERTTTPNANNPGIHTASNAAQEVLLAVSEVSCNDEKLSVLWDSGANISLITHRAAASANLRGNPIDLSITKVGNQNETIRSKRYLVPLNDANGKLWRIYAYGIEEITSALKYVNMSSYASHFSQIKIEDINRPYGTVDMLIGIDCCAILPQVVETVGNLQLLKNQFGYCIRGCHSTYDNKSPSIKQVKIVNGTASYINNISVRTVTDLKKRLDDYFTVDNLGTSCTPKCGGCRCGKCAHGNSNYTLQEERELAHIKQGITFDSERKKFTAHYPWIKDPSDLPNNIAAAEAKLKSTERRLMKMGTEHAEAYNEQMQDMVRRGIARKLSKEEIERYKGPVHYLQHHEIIKPTSSSTPLRIVFNSSASFMGHVLNDYWAKGPDVINSLFGILLRFREQKVGLVADISKMFNSIQLAEMDQHVHRYLWRDLDIRQDPSHYVLLAVAFGDRPSGTISMVALKTIAEMNEDKYEVAAKMITRNSYIDDLIQSVSCVDDAVALAKNVEHILDQGGFKIKYWIISGTGEDTTELQSTIKLMNPDREKILGISWSPASDQFLFHVQINFSPKCRNVSTDPAMTEANMTSAFPQIVTRRMLLGQTARIFDPLGLITPVTLGAKLLLRKLVSKPLADELGWDDPLPEDNRAEWRSLFEDLLMLREVSFTRCTKPIEAIGEPTLVIFSDASMHAYGARAYAQWLLKSGKYEAQLIAAKNRIAPTRQMSIPRLELCGALLGCRL